VVCMAKVLLYRCTDVLARVYVHFCVSVVCTKQVSWAPVHAGVHIPQVVVTSPYISAKQSLKGVHMRSCICSLFIRQ